MEGEPECQEWGNRLWVRGLVSVEGSVTVAHSGQGSVAERRGSGLARGVEGTGGDTCTSGDRGWKDARILLL